MTDTMFTRTALTEAAKHAGVTTDQARTILEAAGVKVQPEKPALPTEPGSVIIATEVRGETGRWPAFLEPDGTWATSERVGGRVWHRPERITAWTRARVAPAATTPVTLTEDQVGEVWDAVTASDPEASLWVDYPSSHRARFKAVMNAALAQHAAPAEGEPIDLGDVREGDRVRVVLKDGDAATFTVTRVGMYGPHSRFSTYDFNTIRSVRLLNREEA